MPKMEHSAMEGKTYPVRNCRNGDIVGQVTIDKAGRSRGTGDFLDAMYRRAGVRFRRNGKGWTGQDAQRNRIDLVMD